MKQVNLIAKILVITFAAMVLLTACSGGNSGNNTNTGAGGWTDISVDDLNYKYNAELEGISIEKYKGKNALKVRIPDKIDGYPVVKIGNAAFSGEFGGAGGGIKEIHIPETVVELGNNAFNSSGLTNINLPAGLKEIGEAAFQHCVGLTSIVIPDGVEGIKSRMFQGCTRLESVTIPNSVTWIGSAFNGCTSLTSINIPYSVTYLDVTSFSDCTSLTEIIVDSNNAEFADIDGVLFSKDKSTLLKFPEGRGGVYIVPDVVTRIAENAFDNNQYLTSVILPNSTTGIEQNAFSFCVNLTSVTLPSSITNIVANSFWQCGSLDDATIQRILEINPDAVFDE